MPEAIDALLTTEDEQAALSIAYVQAIAARAGYTSAVPTGPDRDSVDIQLSAAGAMRPRLDLQCKSTVNLPIVENTFRYPLKRKNYDDLIVPTQTPRLLVVLALPNDASRWLSVSVTELVLRTAAYWISLKGWDETENTTSVTIPIPTENLFDVSAVQTLMEQSRSGALS